MTVWNKSPSHTHLALDPFFRRRVVEVGTERNAISPHNESSTWIPFKQICLFFLVRARRYLISVIRNTQPWRRDVTDQCCRGVARPFRAVTNRRWLARARSRSAALGPPRSQLRWGTSVTLRHSRGRVCAYSVVGDIRRVSITECRVSSFKRCYPPLRFLQSPWTRGQEIRTCAVSRSRRTAWSCRGRTGVDLGARAKG